MLFRNEKGLSLIETVIGLAVFALIGIVILTCLGAAARANISNENLSTAESLGRTQMEYVKNQSYNATGNGTAHPPAYSTISLPTGYSFTTPLENMATRINSSGNSVTSDTGLQQITVTIKYYNKTLYTLTDYKVNR
jgi:hypothetical protein